MKWLLAGAAFGALLSLFLRGIGYFPYSAMVIIVGIYAISGILIEHWLLPSVGKSAGLSRKEITGVCLGVLIALGLSGLASVFGNKAGEMIGSLLGFGTNLAQLGLIAAAMIALNLTGAYLGLRIFRRFDRR